MPDIVSRIRWWQFVISIIVAGFLGGVIGMRFNNPTVTGFISSFAGIIISIIYIRLAQRKG